MRDLRFDHGVGESPRVRVSLCEHAVGQPVSLVNLDGFPRIDVYESLPRSRRPLHAGVSHESSTNLRT
jgi:hypothetical protein